MTIVTRDSLQEMVMHYDHNRVMHVVGRACVALFKRQVHEEQLSNTTSVSNNVGFSATDAKCGSLTAKFYIKHGHLTRWQVEKWTERSARTGYSRIVKYHKQLNEIAEQRAAARQR